VSRVGLSLLSQLGLEVLAAHSPDQYVAKAATLANQVKSLASLRTGLRSRMQASSLCDARRFARELEAAYRQMWSAWCDTQIQNRESKTQNGVGVVR
jgi:protein O-GlcNAc transferase